MSLLASAIDAVGPVIQWSDKGPFGSGSDHEAEMSTLSKYLQSSKQFVLKQVYAIPGTELKRKYTSIINVHGINFCEPIASHIIRTN